MFLLERDISVMLQKLLAAAQQERYPERSKLQMRSKLPSETVFSRKRWANNFEELF